MPAALAGFRTDTSARISGKLIEGLGSEAVQKGRRLPMPSNNATKIFSLLEDAQEKLQKSVNSGLGVFPACLHFCDQTRSRAISLFVLRAWPAEFQDEWIDRYVSIAREGADLIAQAIKLKDSDLSDDERGRCKAYLANILERAKRLQAPASDWGIVRSMLRPLRTDRFPLEEVDDLREELDSAMQDARRLDEIGALARELLFRCDFEAVERWVNEPKAQGESLTVLRDSVGPMITLLALARPSPAVKGEPNLFSRGLLVAAMEFGNLTGELIGEKGPLKPAFRSLQHETHLLIERLEIVESDLRSQQCDEAADQVADLTDRVRATIEAPLRVWERRLKSQSEKDGKAAKFENGVLQIIRSQIAPAAEFLAQAAFYAAVTGEPLEAVSTEYDARVDSFDKSMASIRLERVLKSGEVENLVGSYPADDLEMSGVRLDGELPIRFRCRVVSRARLKGGDSQVVILPWRKRTLSECRKRAIKASVEKAFGGNW